MLDEFSDAAMAIHPVSPDSTIVWSVRPVSADCVLPTVEWGVLNVLIAPII